MPFENVDRAYLEEHVVFSQSTEDGTKIITLNGIKGFIHQDVFKAVGLMSTEQVDIENIKIRKSMFDVFSKPTDFLYGYPSIKILNDNPDVHLQGYAIQTMIIESPVRTKEIAERIATRAEMEKKVGGSESLLEEIDNFIKELTNNPPKNEDSSIDKIQGIFDHVHNEIEIQIESNGELNEANEDKINETMDIVEKYVCTALYNNILSPKWSNDNVDDEAFSSKVAALNILELGLSNLGVDVKPQQQERIDLAVQAAGVELQNLEQKKAPHEKLNILIQCHRIIVEALEKKKQQSIPNSDSVNYKTAASSQNSYVTSPSADVSPASIPLPPSPTSPKLPEIPMPMSPTSTSPTDEKSGDPNADSIFPLLIFIVVKSNPKKLISNLRFMSRYRVRSLLCGESSYCLTNIMAVVQFLENAEYLTLGLPPDKIESVNTNPSLEQRTRKMGQDIAVVADNGLKVITGVMDSSVKMIGRFIGYNENTSDGSLTVEKSKTLSNTNTDQSDQNFIKNSLMNDIKMIPGLPEKGAVKELAEINKTKDNISTEGSNVTEETKSLTDRLLTFNVLPPLRFSSSNDRNHVDEEENKKQNVNKPANKISPPIQKFLDCPFDEFRVNDVPELLKDYKRLADAIRDLGLFSS